MDEKPLPPPLEFPLDPKTAINVAPELETNLVINIDDQLEDKFEDGKSFDESSFK